MMVIICYGFYLWVIKAPEKIRIWLPFLVVALLSIGLTTDIYNVYNRVTRPFPCCPDNARELSTNFTGMNFAAMFKEERFFGIKGTRNPFGCACRGKGYYDPVEAKHKLGPMPKE
jgi:hypothetical protein